MSEHVLKSHNKTLLFYHLVFPSKYRRKVFSKELEESLKNICIGISERYELNFVEIGVDDDHVHFLIQSVPILSITKIVITLKSISARELFKRHKELKKLLWVGNLLTSGYYANTVGQYANEDVISNYVKNQRKEYRRIYRGQLRFDL